MMTEESLAALNNKLIINGVTEKNFRPSIMIKGTPGPFAEDLWDYIRIGDKEDTGIFKTARPCIRLTDNIL